MISLSSHYLKGYLQENFSKKSLDESTLNVISKISNSIGFLCNDAFFKTIRHIDIFYSYSDCLMVLFFVSHPSYRSNIYSVVNSFTLYYKIKDRFLNENKGRIVSRLKHLISDLFYQIQGVVEQYRDTYNSKKLFTQSIEKINYSTHENIEKTYRLNIRQFDDNLKRTRELFFSYLTDFGNLVSTFSNLMLFHNYNENINKLTSSDFIDILKDYAKYLKSLKSVPDDLVFTKAHIVSRVINQLNIIVFIYYPNSKLEFSDDSNQRSEENSVMTTFFHLSLFVKQNRNDYELYHKLIYSINRFISSTPKIKSYIDPIYSIANEIKKDIYAKDTPIVVTREGLRLLFTLICHPASLILWCKFDSKKCHFDFANYSDLVFKTKTKKRFGYKSKKITESSSDQLIKLPYLRVNPFRDSLGLIFHDEHYLMVPNNLYIGKCFTLMFRMFNPVHKTKKFHTLLQDDKGLGGLLVVDSEGVMVGSFTEEGEWISSDINLKHKKIMNSWVQIAMCYSEIDKQSKLNYYINGELKRSYINEKIILPKIIKYIGNSADFDEPFGAFCDLRIYKGFLESDKVYRLFELNQKISDNDFEFIDYLYSNCLNTILANFIESDDFSEETFYFMIKIINALVAYSDFRYRFIVHKIIMKINSFLNVEKFEIKKDIAKFNISIA